MPFVPWRFCPVHGSELGLTGICPTPDKDGVECNQFYAEGEGDEE